MDEKIEKIVVKSDDELIDVVRQISNTEAKKILISFVESSEILISSINLKVLLDSADEKEALIILQILGNPPGVRNAKLAEIPLVETPGLPSEEIWEEVRIAFKERSEKNSKSKKILPQDYKSENITSFEERINSVLTKNKEERVGGKEKEGSEGTQEGIVIDKDITDKKGPPEDFDSGEGEDLTKVDFKNVPNPIKSTKKSPRFISRIGDIFKNLKKKRSPSTKDVKGDTVSNPKGRLKKRLLRILPKVFISVVVVLLLFLYLYYTFAPFVNVTIFIESKPVEVEKVFDGNENIKEIDFENNQIPIKTEMVTKSVSDTVTATGTAFRGDKATGNVTISYINPEGCSDADEPITLTEGQKITERDGQGFLLTGSVTITCNNYSVVGVEAVEVGEEYNVASGKYFSVEGYNSTNVYGVNSGAFTGGSKEEYTVLSQKDVNDKVKELTDIATEEAERELEDIGNGWELIESTIESDVKEGSIDTAVAVGSETDSSDVSLEVESSATYYYTSGVDEGLNDLLTEAALNQNLFESSEGLNLTLKGDIEKELKVNDDDGDIQITLVASSAVEPSVDKSNLLNSLSGMSWEDGIDYLNGLTFTADRAPVLDFNPDSFFPPKLRYFPSRQGRIQLTVKEVSIEGE